MGYVLCYAMQWCTMPIPMVSSTMDHDLRGDIQSGVLYCRSIHMSCMDSSISPCAAWLRSIPLYGSRMRIRIVLCNAMVYIPPSMVSRDRIEHTRISPKGCVVLLTHSGYETCRMGSYIARAPSVCMAILYMSMCCIATWCPSVR